MQELEILEEIDAHAIEFETFGVSDDYISVGQVKEIIRKHMNAGWIPVEDERLWDILFEEACVEGEQARRIYNRLKETFDGERSEMNGKL